MATVFEVYAVHADGRYAAQAAQAAFDLVDRLERELSRFLPNSDITPNQPARRRASARGSAPSTLECLVIARHMFELTGGAFDVSIGTGLPSLELDADECVVRATTRGVQIDLGGIGKGYAVDLMAELLEEWGVERALVHGGFSSVLALEPPAGSDGLAADAERSGAIRPACSRGCRCARPRWARPGVRKGDHIVDPRTGEPVRGRLAAWVAVPRPPAGAGTATGRAGSRPPRSADALTTAFMLLRAGRDRRRCASAAPGVEAWILEDGSGDEPVLHFAGSARQWSARRSSRTSGSQVSRLKPVETTRPEWQIRTEDQARRRRTNRESSIAATC